MKLTPRYGPALALFPAVILIATAILANAQQSAGQRLPHYVVRDLGTFGGNYSYGYGINDLGWVAGGAATPSETNYVAEKAFLWYGSSRLIDIGTLDREACPNCSSEAGGPNHTGQLAVISETAKPGYEGEDFCAFGTHRQCLGALWNGWRLVPLEPFAGGHNSQAYWINNFARVAGFAENGIEDSTCSTGTPYQKLRFEGAIWEPNGEIRKLRPLTGDTVGFAFGINDEGQAVGTSGLCSNVTVPPNPHPGGPHAVLWEREGTPINLGSLGGTYNVATSINDRGDVAGNGQSASDGHVHPFLWTRDEGMQDLGAMPGANLTVAPCCNDLNDHRQIAGFWIDANFNFHAYLWEHGTYTDLNTLIPANSDLYLTQAASINDSGQIGGNAIVKSACPVQSPPAWLVNQSACPVVHAFMISPR